MPASDAHRVWFTEMIGHLRTHWRPALPFDALIGLRDHLDAMLQHIRASRQIRSPIIHCRHCGHTHPAAPPHVSVRAMILSLGRFEVASPDEMRVLEKAWEKHRRGHGLDLHGKPADSTAIHE